MDKKPLKPRNKPFFSYDENTEFLEMVKNCNKLARFISVKTVMGFSGAKDNEIIKKCNKKDYHVITHNTKHYKYPYPYINIGIICVNMTDLHWIDKINLLFKKYDNHRDYFNKSILIGNEVRCLKRDTGDISLLF